MLSSEASFISWADRWLWNVTCWFKVDGLVLSALRGRVKEGQSKQTGAVTCMRRQIFQAMIEIWWPALGDLLREVALSFSKTHFVNTVFLQLLSRREKYSSTVWPLSLQCFLLCVFNRYAEVNVSQANWNIVSLLRLLLPQRRLSLLIANCRPEINTLSF